MKLVKPSFEIWEQEPGLEGIYKQIEKSAKVCYKSEGNITEDSAKPFIDNVLLKRHHYSPLEHGTVYLKIPIKAETSYRIDEYNNNPYTKTKIDCDLSCYYISTNYRVLIEYNWLNDLEYLCEPTEYHERRVCVHFVCDRGVSHEFVRHRVFSFAQESTRYCNYSKNKFGNELTFIIPCWLDIPEGKAYWHDGINYRVGATEENPFGESVNPKAWFNKESNCVEVHDYIQALDSAEKAYFRLMDKWENRVTDRRYITGFRGNPWTPQQARAVLPNALKTELVMTGFVEDWINFFKLRTASNAHLQARELAIPLREEFTNKKIL